jgi:hypothetical protein
MKNSTRWLVRTLSATTWLLAGGWAAAQAPAAATPAPASAPVPAPASAPAAPPAKAPPAAAGSAAAKRAAHLDAGEPRAQGEAPGQSPGQTPSKGSDRVDLDATTVTGNQELPKVMYIVPWKKSDIGDLAGKPMNSLLDEVLAPVDRDVFRREVKYYDAVHADASQNGAAPTASGRPADPAQQVEK